MHVNQVVRVQHAHTSLVVQETDRIMEEMYKVLEQHQSVGWLELVMNHTDFSQTVENIFTLSFLVRAQILLNKNQMDSEICGSSSQSISFLDTSICFTLLPNVPMTTVKFLRLYCVTCVCACLHQVVLHYTTTICQSLTQCVCIHARIRALLTHS